MIFIDFKKAFDSVNRNFCLKLFGLSGLDTQLFRELFADDLTGFLKNDNSFKKSFRTCRGFLGMFRPHY